MNNNKLAEALYKLQNFGLNARLEERDETLLIWATSEGYTDIALELIDAEADLDAVNSDGNTALIRAACEGRIRINDALIAMEADLNIQNEEGYCAIALSKRRGNMDVFDSLERAGARKDLTTVDGRTLEEIGNSPKTPLKAPRDAELEAQIIHEVKRIARELKHPEPDGMDPQEPL